MKVLSTDNLNILPSPEKLQATCRSLAVLDAILCPETENRCFNYNKNYSRYEELFEMKDGEGNYLQVLFHIAGTVINGFACESQMNGWQIKEGRLEKRTCFLFLLTHKPSITKTQQLWPGITKGLPACFHSLFLEGAAANTGTTFCIWKLHNEAHWKKGDFKLPTDTYKDGSEYLMALLDGSADTFINWAKEYYDMEDIDTAVVKDIYNNCPITRDMIFSLNPELENFTQLITDLKKIGY